MSRWRGPSPKLGTTGLPNSIEVVTTNTITTSHQSEMLFYTLNHTSDLTQFMMIYQSQSTYDTSVLFLTVNKILTLGLLLVMKYFYVLVLVYLLPLLRPNLSSGFGDEHSQQIWVHISCLTHLNFTGVLLCAEQSVIEMCSDVDPKGSLTSTDRPQSLSQSLTDPLLRPVRLDPLDLEITPNSLCTLTGQCLLSLSPVVFMQLTLSKLTPPQLSSVFSLLRGAKPLVFSYLLN